MNKLLRDLAEQSIIYKSNGQGNDIPKPVFNKEKFAELIIHECADYIQHFYGDIAASSIGNDIKLHFGIEE